MNSMKMTGAALIVLALIVGGAPAASANTDCQESEGIIGIGLFGIIGIGQYGIIGIGANGIIGIGTNGIIGIGGEEEATTSSQMSCDDPDVAAFGIIGIGDEEG